MVRQDHHNVEILRQQATALLMVIWRGIPADYKSRYRMDIWTIFENEIRSAAYTNNLGKFVNSLCSRLGATIGTRADERATAEAILNSGQDAALLKLLREETVLIVLMVRVAIQARRADYDELEFEFKEEND